ncbi:MAG: hypothetical protein ACR2FV_00260 [Ornithinimicrobium sp.]|uniref:hypothetical protein n=1 Tax=Ornithinimicrobium sp. TaxID=1977084 RepID=UPI003D9B037D
MARELVAVTLDIPLDTVAVDVHIAVEEVDRLIELAEDVVDIRGAQEARRKMEESGDGPIPWETVKAELGLR